MKNINTNLPANLMTAAKSKLAKPLFFSMLVLFSASAFASSCPESVAGQALTAVKAKVDSVECVYGPSKDAQASNVAEIVPDRSAWGKGVGAELVCEPSAGNACGFEVVGQEITIMQQLQGEHIEWTKIFKAFPTQANWEALEEARIKLGKFKNACAMGAVPDRKQCVPLPD